MKKSIYKILSAVALLLCAAMLLSGCIGGNKEGDSSDTVEETTEEVKQDIVVFADGEYKIKFISPAVMENDITAIRNEIRSAIRAKTGVTPSFVSDERAENDDSVVELLVGKTNRPESAAPEGVTEGSDSYSFISVVNNKIVITGSDAENLRAASDHFIETYLSGDKVETLTLPGDIYKLDVKQGFTRENWELSKIPAYTTGSNRLITRVYNCGTTIRNLTNKGNNDTSTELMYILDTSLEEFNEYRAKLESFGYAEEFENQIEENYFASYYNGEHRIYTYLYGKSKEARVIYDPTGISVDEFGYSYTPAEGEETVFYQYGLPMTDGKGNGHPNCGMMYIIKCADNSVIIIDGGDYEGDGGDQLKGEAQEGFDKFLHEITGTEMTEKVRISAWYLTHYHSDHTRGLLEFLRAYGDGYTLERVMSNIPEGSIIETYTGTWEYGKLDEWKMLISQKYPECKEIKIHTGQEIQIADVTMQVIFTHEDLLTEKARFNSLDSNDSSSIVRFLTDEMSLIVLGDASRSTETAVNRNFTSETLKSDIMTAAHHMIYNLPYLYKNIEPKVVYISQAYEIANSKSALDGTTYEDRFNVIKRLVGDGNYYFAGNCTVGYAHVDGALTRVYYSDEVVGRRSGSK